MMCSPKNSEKVNFHLNLGNTNFTQEKFCVAIKNFDKAIKFDPNFNYLTAHDVFYFLGESYRRIGQFNTSIKYLEDALEIFESGQGTIDIWQIYLALARTLRESPDQVSTKSMPYYYKTIEILVPKIKRKRIFWFKTIPIPPDVAEGILEAYYYIGLQQLLKQEYDKAIYSLTEAINAGCQNQPLLAQAYFFLGRTCLLNGDNKQAIKILQRLMKLDHDFEWVDEASIYYDIGQAYYKEQNYTQSLKYKLKILDLEKVEPDLLADVHLGLGHTYYSTGSFEKAVEHYQECIKLTDPKSSTRRTAIECMVSANEALANDLS